MKASNMFQINELHTLINNITQRDSEIICKLLHDAVDFYPAVILSKHRDWFYRQKT